MKPVLNFQIPFETHTSLANINTLQKVITNLRDRLSEHYEVVVTPFQMQSDNMVSITINPDTDINEVLKQLTNPKKVSPYDFHRKYMPLGEYHVRDYDGDETVHPLDMMDDYWLSIIEMVNYTGQDSLTVLRALEKLDINPFTIDEIHRHNGSDDVYDIAYNRLKDMRINHPDCVYVINASDGYDKEINRLKHSDDKISKYDVGREYIRWMIEEVNFSSRSTDEILNEIEKLQTNVFSVTKMEDDPDTGELWFYWPNIVDRTCQSVIGTLQAAGYSRRMNREAKKNGTSINNNTNC